MLTNSNPSSHKRFPNNFRDTFGILRKDGKKYKDIISANLHLQRITIEDIARGYIHHPSRCMENLFVIHTDYETYKTIQDNKEADCLISFQNRTNGRFAMCRLFKQELVK